jgi:hypothetical protein
MEKRLPGTDIKATITVKNAGGDAYDLSTELAGLAIYVFVKPNKVIGRYSLNPVANFKELVVEDAAAGQVSLIISGNQTKGLNEVVLYAIAVAQGVEITDSFKFGTLDGKKYEVVYLTDSPATEVPELS